MSRDIKIIIDWRGLSGKSSVAITLYLEPAYDRRG
jgi:hypothetical protein